MAHKIPVENSGDKHKKSIALLLIRRQLAVGLYDAEQRLVMIRYTPTSQPLDARAVTQPTRRVYIPAELPPAEIGGCHFVPPTPTEAPKPPSFYGHA